ncbi:trehalose and maltose hydrolase (phosphorylase), partial [Neobacillus bataviensis LMG 21833]
MTYTNAGNKQTEQVIQATKPLTILLMGVDTGGEGRGTSDSWNGNSDSQILGANQFLDASVGSRGLTGEGYRGHIFWDEIFVLPYYAANEPETARDLLLYRINRLTAAQENAKVDGEIGLTVSDEKRS